MTIFLLKLTLCWVFFALLYALLLRHETFFRANRAYLLGTALLGMLLAALPAERLPVPAVEVAVMSLPEFSLGMQQVEAAASTWQSLDYLWVAYWMGFGLMAARALWGLYKIVQMARRSQTERLADGCLLVQTEEAEVPFSFFKWVFVPKRPERFSNRSNADAELMLAHERAHAHGWHSADVLFAEALCTVFWFHPAAHWYRRALRTVHEYLADAEASRLSDRKQYGLLLIGQSQSGMPVAFANHFFQSPLKQRLVMLTKKASAPIRAAKFCLLAPLALLFAILFRQAPALAQAVDENHRALVHELEAKGWVNPDTAITSDPEAHDQNKKITRINLGPEKDKSGQLVYQVAEQQPQFPGGQAALVKYLSDHLKYPESARQNKLEGMVVVSFVVDENGKVTKLSGTIKEPTDAKRPLVEEAVRVVSSMPPWVPAQHKGKPVRCSMKLPISFSLAGQADKPNLVDAEFPGGINALMKFLSDNLQYPEAAKNARAEGMVVVSFMVKEDGTLSHVKQTNTDQSLHPDLVKEALRVVSTMPKWKPGMKDGNVVKSELSIPVKFKL